jgi:hypothetical protein
MKICVLVTMLALNANMALAETPLQKSSSAPARNNSC